MPKPLTVWITTNYGKFFKRWKYQTSWPASWEICMQVKKQQLELYMKQKTGSKLGKEYIKALYCHAESLAYVQSTSLKKFLTGCTTSWNQDCGEKYQQPQICRWHHTYGRKWRRTKEPLDENERRESKSWLKTHHSENEDHGIWSHQFMANRWGKIGHSDRLYFGGAPVSLQMVTKAMRLKDSCSLEEKVWPNWTAY